MNELREKKDPALGDLLCFSIYSAEHAFTQLYRPQLAELGLTYPQYLVMTLLWDRDDRTVRDLGGALHLQSNTLTPLLKRLEALGHVSRSRDLNDERVVRIRLTDKGKALKTGAADIPNCIGHATGMSPEELRSAIKLIDRLRHNVSRATL
ncbi:MAG: MarR family transcriptional regulator [Rhodobacteraceae bacterium]|nr:MarR family transcriptional regulator [Paracoccaceae bacterium]